MTQLSDDCFAFGGPLIETEAALALLEERLTTIVDQETIPIQQADGRILASNILSHRSVPPHDNAAVDGYAVYFDDLSAEGDTALPLDGRIAAGHPLDHEAERGSCWRIFTGAPMPDGPDTIIMQEDCTVADNAVTIPPGIKRGANRRHAGEDIQAGDLILKAGKRLRAQDIGLLASIGITEIQVFNRLRVALFSTGDEVRDIGSPLPDGSIYDANRYSISSLLTGLGCVVSDLGILPDSREAIKAALDQAAGNHDVVMTSAGVSTGEEDHVRNAVEALGSIHFWRLAIRPGRPIAFGQVGAVPFIGLPGNPVAVMVTFMRFARPALLRMGGCTETAPAMFRVPAQFSYRKKAGRREWLRVMLRPGADGTLAAEKYAKDGAGILSSMVAADGLAELPEPLTEVTPGTMVDFLPFSEVS